MEKENVNYWTVPENLPDAVLMFPALSLYWNVMVPRNEEAPEVNPVTPWVQVTVFSVSKLKEFMAPGDTVQLAVRFTECPFSLISVMLALSTKAP